MLIISECNFMKILVMRSNGKALKQNFGYLCVVRNSFFDNTLPGSALERLLYIFKSSCPNLTSSINFLLPNYFDRLKNHHHPSNFACKDLELAFPFELKIFTSINTSLGGVHLLNT